MTNLRAPQQPAMPRRNYVALTAALLISALGYGGWSAVQGYQAFIATGKDFIGAPYVTPEGKRTTWDKAYKATTPFQMAYKCSNDPKCRPHFEAAFGQRFNTELTLMIFGGLFFAATVAKVSIPSKLVIKDPGQARWAGLNDVNIFEITQPKQGPMLKVYKESQKRNPASFYIGHFIPWENGYFYWKNPQLAMLGVRDRHEHVLIVGASGSGKTRGIIRQNIVQDLKDGRTAIVYDLKWPQTGSGFRDLIYVAKQLNREVAIFAPFSPTSMRIPLLDDINTIDEGLKLARAIIAPPEYGAEPGEHYKNSERRTLAAMALTIAQSPTPTMKELQRLGEMNAAEIETWYKNQTNQEVKHALKSMFDKRNDQISDLLGGVMNKLQIFYNANVSRATTRGNDPREVIDLEAFIRKGGLLIIGIESKYIQGGEGELLLQLIKRRVDRALMDVADATPGGALAIPATYYFDELPGLGRLPNLDKQLAQWRSKNIAIVMGVQNDAQGAVRYGKAEWEAMTSGNAGTKIYYLRGTDPVPAQDLSKRMGEITVDVEAESQSQHAVFGSKFSEDARKTSSIKLDKRPMMSHEEIQRAPRGLAVVFAKGQNPMLAAYPALEEKFMRLTTLEGQQVMVKNELHEFWNKVTGGLSSEEIERRCDAIIAALSVNDAEEEPARDASDYWRSWLDELIYHGAVARTQRSDDKFKVMIRRDTLPEHLNQEKDLSYFFGQGWLNQSVQGDEITILQPGLDEAGSGIISELQELLVKGPALHWARTHPTQVTGYPGNPSTTGPARYTGNELELPLSTAQDIYGVIPELPRSEDGQRIIIPLNQPDTLKKAFVETSAQAQRPTPSPTDTQSTDPQEPSPTATPSEDKAEVLDNLLETALKKPSTPQTSTQATDTQTPNSQPQVKTAPAPATPAQPTPVTAQAKPQSTPKPTETDDNDDNDDTPKPSDDLADDLLGAFG